MQVDSSSYLNRTENVDISVLAANQPCWIQALNSDAPSAVFSFSVSSVFKSFACYSDGSCVCRCCPLSVPGPECPRVQVSESVVCCLKLDGSIFSSEVSPTDHQKLYIRLIFQSFLSLVPPKSSGSLRILFLDILPEIWDSLSPCHTLPAALPRDLPRVLREADLMRAECCECVYSIALFTGLMSTGQSSDRRGRFFFITIMGSCCHCQCHHPQGIFLGTGV